VKEMVKKYEKTKASGRMIVEVPPDARIVLVNNTYGNVFAQVETLKMDFREPADFFKVRFDDLKKLIINHPAYLKEHTILIVDVESTENLTIAQVYDALGMGESYDELIWLAKDEDKIDTGLFEKTVVNADLNKIKRIFNSDKLRMRTKRRLLEAMIVAFRAGVLTRRDWDSLMFAAIKSGFNTDLIEDAVESVPIDFDFKALLA
jgi:hypothetical protein